MDITVVSTFNHRSELNLFLNFNLWSQHALYSNNRSQNLKLTTRN